MAIIAIVMAVGLFLMHGRAVDPNPAPTIGPVAEKASDGFLVVDWEYWQGKNPDVAAWIYAPETNVSYPVVQEKASERDFYLYHDVERAYSIWGCPYIDADCLDGTDSMNVIISGHHMDDGTMFTDFAQYMDEGWARQHETVYVMTPEKNVKLRVVAAEMVDVNVNDEKYASFSDVGNLQRRFSQIIDRCQMVLDDGLAGDLQLAGKAAQGYNVVAPDGVPTQFFSLVTCAYSYQSPERVIVYCVPEEME